MIELQRVDKRYASGENSVLALRGINLRIERGSFVAIMGPSGSGKSTLMNLLGLLDRPTSGEYLFDGVDVGSLSDDGLARLRRDKLGFVFQSFNLFARKNAVDNVAAPLLYAGVSPRERRERAMAMLQRVGLAERAGHRPKQLSGGQQQRVAIARALVNAPPVILADEPTGNLDQHTGREVLALLQDLHDSGVTLLMVTHDEHVARHAQRVLRLVDGQIRSDERNEQPLRAATDEAAA